MIHRVPGLNLYGADEQECLNGALIMARESHTDVRLVLRATADKRTRWSGMSEIRAYMGIFLEGFLSAVMSKQTSKRRRNEYCTWGMAHGRREGMSAQSGSKL